MIQEMSEVLNIIIVIIHSIKVISFPGTVKHMYDVGIL
jgi:hypothetical protein